jgi:hypothetical protein
MQSRLIEADVMVVRLTVKAVLWEIARFGDVCSALRSVEISLSKLLV